MRHLAQRERCWQMLLIVILHGRAASLSERGSKPFMTCLLQNKTKETKMNRAAIPVSLKRSGSSHLEWFVQF